jgi:hypothetical protein
MDMGTGATAPFACESGVSRSIGQMHKNFIADQFFG